MGNCCSTDPAVIEIGPKTIRQSKMKTIKTYEDAMRIIGVELKDSTGLAGLQQHFRA
jgi:hypothetical protein